MTKIEVIREFAKQITTLGYLLSLTSLLFVLTLIVDKSFPTSKEISC